VGEAPKVLFWFRFYAALMALLYALCFVAGIAMAVFSRQIAAEDAASGYDATVLVLYGAFLSVLGLVLCAVFVAALVLPPRPWVWVYDIVLIALGLSSPCCLPFSLALLIYWVKYDTSRYFGR